MSDIRRIETNARSSRVVVYNGTVFLGGMTAGDRSQDIKGQTAQVLKKIDDFLAQAGTDKTRLLTSQIWLKDISRDFQDMNEVWNAWTAPDNSPTRACVQSAMAAEDILVEIVVSAALP